jgi:hypothetical protein
MEKIYGILIDITLIPPKENRNKTVESQHVGVNDIVK